MNAQDRIAADKAAVEQLRTILSNMDPDRRLQALGNEMMLTAGQGRDGADIAVILPEATNAERDYMLLGPRLALAALRRIDRADDWFRQQRQSQRPAEPQAEKPEPKQKKHGSECAMLCQKEAFGRFMAERYGAEYGPVDPLDADSVAAAAKKRLKISSRSVLNHDAEAVGRWLDLRGEYQAWLQG